MLTGLKNNVSLVRKPFKIHNRVPTWSDHPLPGELSQPRQTHLWLSEQLGIKCNFASFSPNPYICLCATKTCVQIMLSCWYLYKTLILQSYNSNTWRHYIATWLCATRAADEFQVNLWKHVCSHICVFLLLFLSVAHSKLKAGWVTVLLRHIPSISSCVCGS